MQAWWRGDLRHLRRFARDPRATQRYTPPSTPRIASGGPPPHALRAQGGKGWLDAAPSCASCSSARPRRPRRLDPPARLPSYEQARATGAPSEAWLKGRDGRLLQTVRIDFAVRRLPWVPLERISPSLREAVVAAEDRHFRAMAASTGAPSPARPGRPFAAGRRAARAPSRCSSPASSRRSSAGRAPARSATSSARPAPPARSRPSGARTRSSKPISTSPPSAARPRGSAAAVARPVRPGARRARAARMRCSSPPCCPRRRRRPRRSPAAPAGSGGSATAPR